MFATALLSASVFMASYGVTTLPSMPGAHPNQVPISFPGFMCWRGLDAERAARYLLDHGADVSADQMDAAFVDRCSHDRVEVLPGDIVDTGFFYFDDREVHVLKIHTDQRDFWTYWIPAPSK